QVGLRTEPIDVAFFKFISSILLSERRPLRRRLQRAADGGRSGKRGARDREHEHESQYKRLPHCRKSPSVVCTCVAGPEFVRGKRAGRKCPCFLSPRVLRRKSVITPARPAANLGCTSFRALGSTDRNRPVPSMRAHIIAYSFPWEILLLFP